MMSTEQLLFLLLLIAIPLVERAIRAMRARTDDSPGERAPPAAEPTVSHAQPPRSAHDAGRRASEAFRTELPLPASPLPPALPEAARHAASEQIRASQPEPRVRREGQHAPAARVRPRPVQRPSRPAAAPHRVIAGGDLRRAIILVAILGPCRALEPKDAPPRG
jgi:hypothetical protein